MQLDCTSALESVRVVWQARVMVDVPDFAGDDPFVEERYEQLDLAGIEVDGVVFESCVFVAVDWSDAALHRCTFVECTFERCNFAGADLDATRLEGCTFTGCKVTGLDWTRLDWPAVRCYDPLRFEDCNCFGSYFVGLELHGLAFVDCNLSDADFCDTRLHDVDFRGSTLDNARFDGGSVRGVDFRGATGYSIDVRAVRLDGSTFDLPEGLRLLDSLPITFADRVD